jgi:hypothetical protein
MDAAFDEALRRATANVRDGADLNAILRDYLRDCLDRDIQRRVERTSGAPIYAYWWEPGDPETATEADLRAIRDERSSLQYVLKHNSRQLDVEELAQKLLHEHALPEDLIGRLIIGLTEARIRCWDVIERRTLGTEPLVFDPDAVQAPPVPVPGGTSPSLNRMPPAPPASSLVDAFGEWGRKSGGWSAGAENQAKVSMRLFIEVCSDRPIDTYTRADGDAFRSTLRKLPRVYRKSAKDKEKPLTQIIAEAHATKSPRITEKTLKRHFWAVSRFFPFLIETGRLPKDADNPGRGFTFNTKGPARKQRDMWCGDELRRLFTSPV